MTTEDSHHDAETTGVEGAQHSVPAEPGAAEASPPRRRSARRRPQTTVGVQAETSADAEIVPSVPRRRRSVRSTATRTAEVSVASDAPEDGAAVETSSEPPIEKPRRASRSRRAAASRSDEKPAVEAAPEEIQQPATEAASPQEEGAAVPPDTAVPARPRRRAASRGRRVAPAEQEPAADARAEEAGAEPTAVETPAAPPAERFRGRSRGGRRRAAEPIPETASAPSGTAAPADVTEKPARGRRSRGERATKERRPKTAVVEPVSGARLDLQGGFPALRMRDRVVPPTLFFGSVAGQKQARRVASEVQRAARAGVQVLSTLIELICPLPADDSVYESLDERIASLTSNYPEALLLPRLVFVPAPCWRQQYPNEVHHYQGGATDDPSVASERFWYEAELALRKLIAHVRRTTYGERVIGYHLERGEWFHPIYTGYDRSYANREGFREWLRAKYNNNEVALRAAWFDGQVQFYTAEVPPQPAPRPDAAFFEPRRERRWIDFLEYTSEVTAQRLGRLASVVKEASDGEALVSVCYGYTFEFGHTYSGHLALNRLLAEPAIDIVAGPPAYRGRQPGGSGAFPSPVNSIGLHGKLWISEDDTKTHLAVQEQDDDYNPRMAGRAATEAVHARAAGMALAYKCGIGWMDLWGDGWLDSDDVWKSARAFLNRMELAARIGAGSSPEVVVLVDERSLLHVQRGEEFVRRLLHDQRDLLLRSGASVGFYLQSDVTHPDFPTDAKLYLFLTPYRLPEEQRTAIREKIQSGGKTLVWIYAVGTCADRGDVGESPHDLLGFSLRPQAWLSEIGSRVTDARHPITEHIRDRILGVRERLSPSYYVDDDSPGIVTLAEYAQSGLPSLAVREFSDWRSVFCGEPTLSQELVRGLCRYAGVHLYTTGADEYVYSGNGWLTLHAVRDGQRNIRPRPAEALFDLDAQAVVANGGDYRCFMRAGTTRSFLALPLATLRELGLNTERRPEAELEETEPLEEEPTPERDAGEEPDLLVEDLAEALKELEEVHAELLAEVAEEEALAADGDAGLVDSDFAEERGDLHADGRTAAAEAGAGDSDAAEKKRRRRRRGGRGRGRRRRPGASDADGGSTTVTSS